MIFHQPNNSLSGFQYNGAFYNNTIWEPHFHKNFELIYVEEGQLLCNIDSKEYTLNSGQYGLCLNYSVHSYFPTGNCKYWVGVFSPDFVMSFSEIVKNKSADGFVFICEKEIDVLIKKYLMTKSEPDIITLKFSLYAVTHEFLRQIKFTNNNTKNGIAMEIIDYITENHKNKISLSDLAERLGYDYNYVSRLFNNTFNISFNNFLNIYRLESATQALLYTDKKISDIALECGFQSIRSFNYNFYKNIGVTPIQYRKNKSRA